MDEDAIFLEALQRSDSQDRAVFLDQACAGNKKLRISVEQLLAANAKAGSFLTGQAVGLTEAISNRRLSSGFTERPGMQIGPYTLVEQIGQGGFGVVFMAEQQQPVRRKVALKIIKPGMDTREVIARFEAERQALALMDHPNVARVLDAGTTGSSRPFFVMELVRGVPITEYCDEKRLSPRQRLEIVLPVCLAIQHAHQKGIIHRDIKPTNILVAEYDRQPVPKVIDFGVAKAVGPPLTETTMVTGFGQIVGTLEYMSPEQARLDQLDVDTRSDIYSLGVLLYELLTGSTPFERKRLRSAAWDESLRIIREEDPPKPSLRLSEACREVSASAARKQCRPSVALDSIAASRSTDPARLTRVVSGELDWIVMKALEKDRSRRFQSAGDLAADLRRYLSDEPVLAKPPSASYRLSKLIRRNKGKFAATVVTLAALVSAVVLLLVSNAAIRAEQVRTGQERTRALSAKRFAENAQRVAERRASDMRQGVEDLQSANQLLERGRVFVADQRWDDAEAAFSRAIELRPEYAALWRERGELYRRLGLFELAVRDIDYAHGLQEPAQGWIWRYYALLLWNAGDEEGYRKVVNKMRSRFGGTPNSVLAMEIILASTWAPRSEDEAATDVELAQSVVGTDSRNAWFHYGLGVAFYRAKNYEAALQELRSALEDGADWNARRICYPVLAMAQHRLNKSEQAKESLRQASLALSEWTRVRSESPPGNWAVHMGAVGEWPILWWDWLECQLMYEEASVLITGAMPEEDNQLRVLRARALAGLRRTAGAIAEQGY